MMVYEDLMLCWCEDLDLGDRHQQTRIFGDGDLTHVWSLVCVRP